MSDGHGDCSGAHIGGIDAASGGAWVPTRAPSTTPIEERPSVNGAPVDEQSHEYVIKKSHAKD